MGITERKLRQRKAIRSNILKTAIDIAKNEGWKSVSIRKIAEKIEYSTPVIYEHFASKEALLQELEQEGFRLMRVKLLRVKEHEKDTQELVLKLAMTYWDFAWEHIYFYQVMFGLNGNGNCHTEKRMDAPPTYAVETISIMSDALHSLNASVDPKEMVLNWYALSHGFIALAMNQKIVLGEKAVTEMYQRAMLRFIKGIRDDQMSI
jgi:AcrR family transcriptional regulator